MKRIINDLKKFWKDDSGAMNTLETIGLAIGGLVLVGVVTGIGITMSKNKAAQVSTDLNSYKVTAPANMNTSATSVNFSTTAGSSTITGVTLTN